jgi:hypothetical protein
MNNLPLEATPFGIILHSVCNNTNVVAMRSSEVPTALALCSLENLYRTCRCEKYATFVKVCNAYLFTNRDCFRVAFDIILFLQLKQRR